MGGKDIISLTSEEIQKDDAEFRRKFM